VDPLFLLKLIKLTLFMLLTELLSLLYHS